MNVIQLPLGCFESILKHLFDSLQLDGDQLFKSGSVNPAAQVPLLHEALDVDWQHVRVGRHLFLDLLRLRGQLEQGPLVGERIQLGLPLEVLGNELDNLRVELFASAVAVKGHGLHRQLGLVEGGCCYLDSNMPNVNKDHISRLFLRSGQVLESIKM